MREREAPIGPSVYFREKKVTRFPYQEQKDALGPQKYDAILVLGEGPIKSILFSDQLTEEQRGEWESYKADPLGTLEPKFHVIDVTTAKGKGPSGRDRNPFYQIMQDIEHTPDATPGQIAGLKELQKARWQDTSPMVKRRWGRANALAGGMLLYLGKTDKLILTGGHTGKPGTPTEAEMMQDVVIRRYGRLMFERDTGEAVRADNKEQYARYIEEQLKNSRLVLENKADNTIGNVVYSANTDPNLFMPDASLALITSGHHLARGKELIGRLTGKEDVDVLSAQEILEQQGRIREFKTPVIAMQTFQLGEQYDPSEQEPDRSNKLGFINSDLEEKVKGEEKWSSHLTNPEKLLYWVGYIGMLKNPQMVQNIVGYLHADDQRRKVAEIVFKRVGLSLSDYAMISDIAATKYEVFEAMQASLAKLTAKEIRQETF